jgi:hypothetical protein
MLQVPEFHEKSFLTFPLVLHSKMCTSLSDEIATTWPRNPGGFKKRFLLTVERYRTSDTPAGAATSPVKLERISTSISVTGRQGSFCLWMEKKQTRPSLVALTTKRPNAMIGSQGAVPYGIFSSLSFVDG